MVSGSAILRIGDLVRCAPEDWIGIIVDWYVIYDRFGDAVEKLAVVCWNSCSQPDHEYPDMLEVVSESR